MREKASFRAFFYKFAKFERPDYIPHTKRALYSTRQHARSAEAREQSHEKRKVVIESTTTSLPIFQMPLREGASF